MTVKIQDFHDLIKPSVQGCPTTILDSAIRASINELCERSLIWNQELICGTLVEGQRIYKLNYVNSPISIVMPLTAVIRYLDDNNTYRSKELINTNLQELNDVEPTWRELAAPEPERYYMEEPNILSLVERPVGMTKELELYVSCAVKMSRTHDEMPEFLLNDWAETIAHGALYRLHSISGRVWANPNMMQYHLSRFKDGVSRAKSKMYKSYATASKTMLGKQKAY